MLLMLFLFDAVLLIYRFPFSKSCEVNVQIRCRYVHTTGCNCVSLRTNESRLRDEASSDAIGSLVPVLTSFVYSHLSAEWSP